LNELKIAGIIAKKRRDKGITQEELAQYIGVSKAAVSKWEKEQSYPDIFLLPQLAMYFNISVDELLGYSPQLTVDEIRRLCRKVSADFTGKPFDEAMSGFRKAVKKYYSCYSFLYQMALLLINNYPTFNEEQRTESINEAKGLSERIVAECGDPILARDALNIQSLCCVILEEPDEVFSLLGESLNTSAFLEGTLIAQAFMLKGNGAKAKELYQCDIFNFLSHLTESMIGYFDLVCEDFETAQTAYNRAMELIRLFNISKLNPNTVAKAYILGAKMYCKHGDFDKTLELLENYFELCTTAFFPFKVSGDDFFSDIDGWLDSEKSNVTITNEQIIKNSMIHSLTATPAFEALKDNPQYQIIVKRLTEFVYQEES